MANGGWRAYPSRVRDNITLATRKMVSCIHLYPLNFGEWIGRLLWSLWHSADHNHTVSVQTKSNLCQYKQVTAQWSTCVEGLVTGSPELVRVTVICTCWLGIPLVWGENLPQRPEIPVWRPASPPLPAPAPPSGWGRINTACPQCPKSSSQWDDWGHYQDVVMLGLKLLLNLLGSRSFLCSPTLIGKEYIDVYADQQ